MYKTVKVSACSKNEKSWKKYYIGITLEQNYTYVKLVYNMLGIKE